MYMSCNTTQCAVDVMSLLMSRKGRCRKHLFVFLDYSIIGWIILSQTNIGDSLGNIEMGIRVRWGLGKCVHGRGDWRRRILAGMICFLSIVEKKWTCLSHVCRESGERRGGVAPPDTQSCNIILVFRSSTAPSLPEQMEG